MDVALLDLWLPILLSSVIVFLASWVAWMLLPHHKVDWTAMPNEEQFLQSLRDLKIPPGQYMFPFVKMEEMKDPEKKARWEAGPYGSMILQPQRPNFGRNLGLVFVFYVVVSIFVAYLASVVLPPGAEYLKVFQVCGTAAILGYAFGGIPGDIFTGRKARTTLNTIVDGVAYGLLTAGTFAGFWPGL